MKYLCPQKPWSDVKLVAVGVAAVALPLLISGCAVSRSGDAASGGTGLTPTSGIQVSGSIHGGQQPVTGATIQLYTVGTTGLGSASTALITGTTVTTSDGSGSAGNTLPAGNFVITGDYSCSSATQVYLVATGGNSGGGVNSAIALVAALGSCANLIANTNTFIQVNELTTVAAAYGLAPFATDLTHIGASGANPAGMLGAFANTALLANTSTGSAPGAGLATGVTVPVAEINTLGDIIAACVNTSSATSANCNALMSATSASNTFGALLGIAKSPGAAAVTALYGLAAAKQPFQPTLTAQPNDFTIALTTTAAGMLATPYGIAIDASGNGWVTNETGAAVTEISPAGSVLASPAATGLAGAEGIAIDRSGNVWVANTAGNSVVKFTLTAGSVSATAAYTAGGVNAPSAIAIDSAGKAYVANFNGNSVSVLTAAGAAFGSSPFNGSGNITVPQGIALDPAGNAYVTSGGGPVVKLSNAGAYVSSLSDGTLQGPSTVAVDTSSRLVATGYTTGTAVGGGLSEFASTGTAAAVSPVTSGLSTPASVTTDGTSIWVANGTTNGCLTQYAYGASAAVAPSAGFGALNTPAGVAVDATGSVWTTNSGSNTVSRFIGLAVPVVTPLSMNVGP